ncbi:sugar ABC transporter substrate-binding protein [Arthrobacter sp. Cr_A7]|uniref:sugar ABC transporter substrate-binding protein n=1 Tax=Arthrobacter sp. Cr_A7 TaxID=3031017 RepID=UPI0023DB0251|nr:sugar ABC transporter substrate-binding protein [Arthrobacter sp. Cr_A7]MDF2050433.1 sugar ABC transporter substrate-binding protein [Arthrobacter sp. Cr_A7]
MKAANVAYVTYFVDDYQQSQIDGVMAAISPDGGTLDIFNSDFDPEKMTLQCQEAIDSGRYNVILLCPFDPPLGIASAAAAHAAGIPVIAVESCTGEDPDEFMPQVPGIVGSSVATRKDFLYLQSEMVKKACEGKDHCKVFIEIAAEGDPLTLSLVDKVNELPNVEVVEVLAAEYDPSVIARLMPEALKRHPDVDVYNAAGDQTAIAAIPAFEAAGLLGKVKIVGAGGSRAGKKAVEDGKFFSTSADYPYTFGKIAGEMAVKAVNGQKIDPPGVNAQYVKQPSIVTKENVDQFDPEWGAE